ncbi:MAG: DUF992 domain-containing protein [Pseudomonadota bacterium]
MNAKAVLAAAIVAAALAPNTGVAEQPGVKLGILSCELTDKTNVIVYTNETFRCVYNPNSGGTEQYDGEITRIGLDLEWKPEQQLIWAVIAPTREVTDGALAGNYSGASTSASVGAGGGAKLLVGGFEESITLQPVSLAGSVGLGASVGIEALELTAK